MASAQRYLGDGGLSPSVAGYVTIGCFLGGVIGIQIVSRVLHHYIPSHVVDCDHEHDAEESEEDDHDEDSHSHQNGHTHKQNGFTAETTPLLSRSKPELKPGLGRRSMSATQETSQDPDAPFLAVPPSRRPTLQSRLTNRVSTFVSGAKSSCDEGGPCYGYSEPCGHECMKIISRSPTRAPTRAFGRFSNSGPPHQPSLLRTATTPHVRSSPGCSNTLDEETLHVLTQPTFTKRPDVPTSQASTEAVFRGREGRRQHALSHLSAEHSAEESTQCQATHKSVASGTSTANETSHHHHVPSNAFLAIGLQTSIAIALHKLPEGFITYATNHANPKLGFTVFMALFIHNITEGFAMALPLYLAINSRWKAMFWSSLLGGVSQPLGAGVAAAWFKIAGRNDMAPGDTVYGCMFSITAGIMASVALQLFSESLSLTHSRALCTTFAFIGMGILGVSFALTA